MEEDRKRVMVKVKFLMKVGRISVILRRIRGILKNGRKWRKQRHKE